MNTPNALNVIIASYLIIGLIMAVLACVEVALYKKGTLNMFLTFVLSLVFWPITIFGGQRE